MTCEVHVDDVGTALIVTIVDCNGDAINISAATEKKIKLTLPDLSVVEKTAEFSSDGTDGKIQYTTVADDLSQAGRWKIQGFIVDSGFENNSEVAEFKVYSNLS